MTKTLCYRPFAIEYLFLCQSKLAFVASLEREDYFELE